MKALPGLYGLEHSNRNFKDKYYWGKNQFNSSFPAALACYMRDQGHPAVYICHAKDCKTTVNELSISELFGTSKSNNELFFSFEDAYSPFQRFVYDALKPIDLVIKTNDDSVPVRPLEVKLTVLPDNTTSGRTEEEYGAELVIRNPTMRYMAMSMAESCIDNLDAIREIFSPVCNRIRHWDVGETMRSHREKLFAALEAFIKEFQHLQRPLLMQPIWKTIGKSSCLADHCLDIFVWSDFAMTRLFMDSATSESSLSSEKISRQQRTAFRLIRFLHELSKSSENKVFQEPIYDGMNFGAQNDKGFAISGSKTNQYLSSDRLTKPIIHKNEIKNIVLGGGHKLLSPERRFDAILYFSKDLFE